MTDERRAYREQLVDDYIGVAKRLVESNRRAIADGSLKSDEIEFTIIVMDFLDSLVKDRMAMTIVISAMQVLTMCQRIEVQNAIALEQQEKYLETVEIKGRPS